MVSSPRLVRVSAVAILLAGGASVSAQTPAPAARIVDIGKPGFQPELDRFAAEGFAVVMADVSPNLLAGQKRAGSSASFLYIDDVEKALAARKLEPGYRLLPATFRTSNGRTYSAIFEKTAGDDRRHEYIVVNGSSAKDLESKAQKNGDGFAAVAFTTGGSRIAAMLERAASTQPWKILATSKTSTMQEELTTLARDGYRVVAAGGGKELAYLVSRSDVSSPAEYRVIATTKSTTLEKEINDAAAEGFRVVRSSLAGLAASSNALSLRRMTNETALVMEKIGNASPVSYKVIGARRLSTMEKEMAPPLSEGYALFDVAVTFEETVIILQRAP